jgi:AcrR family transcriptional regulator
MLPLRAAREFKQKRAAATYEALLQAAARVFAERGFDEAQTPEIAAEAGVSTGAFYRYFSDKRQIFLEVMADHLQGAYDDLLRRLQPEKFRGDDAVAGIDRALDTLFDHVRRDAPLERELIMMSLRDPEVQKMRADFEAMGLELLTALIQEVVPGRVPDARAAALVIQIAAIEVAAERAELRPRSGSRQPDAAVKTALRDMVHAYLFSGLPPRHRLGDASRLAPLGSPISEAAPRGRSRRR